MDRIGTFLKELRRRRVFRVAALYIIGAWVVLQVADLAFPGLGIPDSAIRYVWIGAFLGFPIALIFGWRFDIIGGHLIHTPDSEAGEPDLSLRRTDYLLLTALVVVVGSITFGLVKEIKEVQAPDLALMDAVEIDPKSIAVLPFADQSAAEENSSFLAFGVHDELLTLLSRLGDLKVISRTSVERYKDSGKSLRQIGRELGVATILEGRVQRAGDRVRINVQLIDATTDAHVWAESYDRQLSAMNIFAVQTELAKSIVGALKATISVQEAQHIESVPTRNLAALESYVLGKQHMSRRTVDDLSKAKQNFERAIDLDPDFALAYVGLSDTLNLQVVFSSAPPLETYPQAKLLALRALELNGALGEAFISLASIKGATDDFDGAETAFKRGIELNPNYATAYHWYGVLLGDSTRKEESLNLRKKAAELDPLSPVINTSLAYAYEAVGNYEKALFYAEKAVVLEPRGAFYNTMSRIYWRGEGKLDLGARWAWDAIRTDPEGAWSKALSRLYLDLGDSSEARRWIDFAASKGQSTEYERALIEYFDSKNGPLGVRNAEIAFANRRISAMHILRNIDLASDRIQVALNRYEKAFPELFSDEGANITYRNLHSAVDLALVFQRSGDPSKARRLLKDGLAMVLSMPRVGWNYGDSRLFIDAEIYALQGDQEKALAALRNAAEKGCRYQWWLAEKNPNFASLRELPEFKAIMDEIRADMAVQLARVREMEAGGDWDSIFESED